MYSYDFLIVFSIMVALLCSNYKKSSSAKMLFFRHAPVVTIYQIITLHRQKSGSSPNNIHTYIAWVSIAASQSFIH